MLPKMKDLALKTELDSVSSTGLYLESRDFYNEQLR